MPITHRKRPRPKYGTPGRKLSADDTKLLARLVNIYGRQVITAAAGKVRTHGPGQPRRGDPPRHQLMHLSVGHIRLLARLVRKYGRKLIASAAGKVQPPRKRGWPARELAAAAYLERIHEAGWVEDVAAEHRRSGSRRPYKDALFGPVDQNRADDNWYYNLYDLLHGEDDQRDRATFERTMKRKRYQLWRELQEARGRALLRKQYLAHLRTK